MGSVANLKLLSPVAPDGWDAPQTGWGVADVSRAAREAAEAAARATGITTGAWLTHAIEASLVPQMPAAGAAAPATAHQAPAGTDEAMPAASLHMLVENIQGLARQLDEAEGRTDAVLDPLAKRISDLTQEFSELTIPQKGAAASLEQQMIRIAERMVNVEETARAPAPPRVAAFVRRLWPTA